MEEQDPSTGNRTLALLGAGVVLGPSTVLTTAVHLIRVSSAVVAALWVQLGPVTSPTDFSAAVR